MDEIHNACRDCTCGIFLFTRTTPLDGTADKAAPRDNVVFEAGYFMHAKGNSELWHDPAKMTRRCRRMSGEIFTFRSRTATTYLPFTLNFASSYRRGCRSCLRAGVEESAAWPTVSLCCEFRGHDAQFLSSYVQNSGDKNSGDIIRNSSGVQSAEASSGDTIRNS